MIDHSDCNRLMSLSPPLVIEGVRIIMTARIHRHVLQPSYGRIAPDSEYILGVERKRENLISFPAT